MVADSHPIAHPPQTIRSLWRVALSAVDEATAKMMAHTIAQAML
jgi:hypothetical protein